MKTNLLAQNDDLVIENLKADVGKSVMNLSHSITFPIDVDGAILPICCVETLPSDSFEISVEALLRQLTPLKVPLMTNLRLNTAFYYCDNRLAWKKWDRFMTGGRSGDELFDIPRMYNTFATSSGMPNKYYIADTTPSNGTSKISYKNSLHTYFGVSMNFNIVSQTYDELEDLSEELPVAFPFFDYQIICRDFYTNVDRLPEHCADDNTFLDFEDINSDWAYDNLFPSDDDEIRLVDGIQRKSGFHSGDDPTNLTNIGFMLDKVRYHNVRDDYFTSSKKAPMRGTPPALSAQTALILPNGTKISLKNTDGIIAHELTAQGELSGRHAPNQAFGSTITERNIQLQIGSDGKPGFSNTTSSEDVGYPVDTKGEYYQYISGETYGDVELEGLLQADWTAADIRLLSQLTVWQELNMLHEPYYNDFLNAHFDNVRVGESAVEKPQYIGGTSQLISINEILQTSQSSENAPLGSQGATAMSLADNFVGRYYSNNYGYIIGVAYIIPEILYKPAMPRHFSRRTKEDYYSPEFANLSMQATLNKEIFFSNDYDWNNAPWGYTGAFDELRSIPNRVAGNLLNPNYTDLQKWVLTRDMSNDNLPAMESTWLSLKNNVDTTAWQVQEDAQHNPFPKFMLQVANYIKAVRPMPKVAIPKAL